MIYAEILAGGKGTRMGNTEMPKQFLMLGDKPIIIHTIEQFLINSNINKVLICCPKDWMSYTKEIVTKYISNSDKIDFVEGGSTRNETIINGCKHVETKYGLNDNDVIVTHDAVRPFINQRIIDDNVLMSQKYDAIDTVIPATDTIVEVNTDNLITNIPLRNLMFQGQTPQTFKISKLIDLYDELTEEEKNIMTDACKIFIIKGKEVKTVLGEVYNVKITTLHDLKLANAILSEKVNND